MGRKEKPWVANFLGKLIYVTSVLTRKVFSLATRGDSLLQFQVAPSCVGIQCELESRATQSRPCVRVTHNPPRTTPPCRCPPPSLIFPLPPPKFSLFPDEGQAVRRPLTVPRFRWLNASQRCQLSTLSQFL